MLHRIYDPLSCMLHRAFNNQWRMYEICTVICDEKMYTRWMQYKTDCCRNARMYYCIMLSSVAIKSYIYIYTNTLTSLDAAAKERRVGGQLIARSTTWWAEQRISKLVACPKPNHRIGEHQTTGRRSSSPGGATYAEICTVIWDEKMYTRWMRYKTDCCRNARMYLLYSL